MEVRRRHIICYQQPESGEEAQLHVRETAQTAANPSYASIRLFLKLDLVVQADPPFSFTPRSGLPRPAWPGFQILKLEIAAVNIIADMIEKKL